MNANFFNKKWNARYGPNEKSTHIMYLNTTVFVHHEYHWTFLLEKVPKHLKWNTESFGFSLCLSSENVSWLEDPDGRYFT